MEQELKRCKKCGEVKVINEFPLRSDNGKRRNECRGCKLIYLKQYRDKPENKIRASELNKEYRKIHREELNGYSKKYQREHLSEFRKYNKKYRENLSEEQKEKQRKRERRYRERWKEDSEYIKRRREWNRQSSKKRRRKITAYEQARKKIDPVFRLKKQIRNEIRMSFKRRGYSKIGRTEELTGLTSEDLCNYLQKTYKDRYGSFWDGKEEVHIDHIIPLATAYTIDRVMKLNHYTNLQLLKSQDNLEKGVKIE